MKKIYFLLLLLGISVSSVLYAQNLPKLAIEFKTPKTGLSFQVKSESDFYVDMGDGKLIHKEANDQYGINDYQIAIYGKTTGHIKVYGEKIILLRIVNKNINELNVKNCPTLQSLILPSNDVADVDLSENLQLRYIDLSHNKLKNIAVDHLTQLDTLLLHYNQLSSLDFPDAPNLKVASVAKNELDDTQFKNIFAKLPLATKENPRKIFVIETNDKNLVYEKTIKKAQEKNWLTLEWGEGEGWNKEIIYNGIPTVSEKYREYPEFKLYSSAPEMKLSVVSTDTIWIDWGGDDHVEIINTQAGMHNMIRKTYGEYVSIYGKNILGMNCGENKISKIIFPADTKFETLLAYNNEISDIDLSSLPHLQTLFIHNNLLKKIDLSSNNLLKILDIHGNTEFDTIDLSPIPNLEFLSIGQTSIKDIDVSKTPELSTFECTSLGLQTIDISPLKKLYDLRVYENSLNEKQCNKIALDLPHYDTPNTGAIYFINKNHDNEKNYPSEVAVTRANEKGWAVFDFNEGVPLQFNGFLNAEDITKGQYSIKTLHHAIEIEGTNLVSKKIKIFDITGKKIYSVTATDTKIVITNILPYQYYFIQIGDRIFKHIQHE